MLSAIELEPKTAANVTRGDGTLAFFAALTKSGINAAIPNLSAKLGAIVGTETALPYVIGVHGGGQCYIASFTRLYMDGAADELGASKSVALRLFAPGVAVGGTAARALGMDDVVTVNNNLFPTCHIGDWSAVDVPSMTAALILKYPRHAIWVKGLTDRLHADELARLKAHGYVVAPSRPIEIFDPTAPDWKMTSHLRKDLSKVRRLPGLHPFVGGPFSAADFSAMERFSRSATVERHSKLMPDYSAAFFRACAAWPDCLFVGLRDDSGALSSFACIITSGNRLTCGSLGYDLNGAHARLHYPALIALTFEQAISLGRPFNVGYGGLEFKRYRGSTPAMELNAFYLRHLPTVKRGLWQTTVAAMSTLAGPVMKRL